MQFVKPSAKTTLIKHGWYHTGHLHHMPRMILMTTKDRKSTRLNSSHLGNSYAVFCLKEKPRRVLVLNVIGGREVQHVRPRAFHQRDTCREDELTEVRTVHGGYGAPDEVRHVVDATLG